MILFAMRRPPRILPQISAQLARTGVAVAVIGDLAGLRELPARWHFPCRTTSSGPLFNHVGVMALCGLLGSRVVEQIGPEGRQRLTRIEGLHDSLGEL